MCAMKNITQAYSQAPWRKQVQAVGLILLALLFAMLVASVYLNISARAAAYGREILIIQDKIRDLELINADLKTQLGILLSSAEMEKRAKEMGFERIERDEVMYIVVQGYTPRQSVILAPSPQNIEKVVLTLPPNFTESLLEWLRRRFLSANIERSEAFK